MEKLTTENGKEIQGIDLPGVPDVQELERRVKNDLVSAISLLNAIYSDPDLLVDVCHFIRGRLINAENAKLNGHNKS